MVVFYTLFKMTLFHAHTLFFKMTLYHAHTLF